MGGHNQISRPRVTGSAQERGGWVLSRAEGTMLGLSAQPCLLPFNLFPPWVLPDQGHRAWTTWCVRTRTVASPWWKEPLHPILPFQGSQTALNSSPVF